MKHTLLTICLIVFALPVLAYNFSETCKTHMNEREVKASKIIVDEKKIPYDPLIFKRKGTEAVEIKKVDFGVPQFSGVHISYKNDNIIICWPEFTYPTAILMTTNNNYYLPVINDTVNVVKVHFHLHVSCGSSCNYSKIETIYFPIGEKPYLEEVFRGSNYEYPTPWFVDTLTFNEAYAFFNSYEFDYFDWRGKSYILE